MKTDSLLNLKTKKNIKTLAKQVKKEHRFAFTPQFEKTIHVQEKAGTFIALAIHIIEALDWELVYYDDQLIKAIHNGTWGKTEEITLTHDHGKVSIKSISSSRSGMWDKGRNSLRVKLFIALYHQIIKEYRKETINEIEVAQRKKDNWDDYIEPETLPAPQKKRPPNIKLLTYSSIFLALALGGVLGTIPFHFYILSEFGIALGFTYGFKHLIRFYNYSNFKKLTNILLVSVVIIFLSSIYYQYLYSNYYSSGFWTYLVTIINQGIMFKGLHIHGLGIIIAFLLRIGGALLISHLRFFNLFIAFLVERIPEPVLDYGLYLSIKGYSEQKIRALLTSKGWATVIQQDMVFEAIQVIISIQEEQKKSI
jgi:hypothetical protein